MTNMIHRYSHLESTQTCQNRAGVRHSAPPDAERNQRHGSDTSCCYCRARNRHRGELLVLMDHLPVLPCVTCYLSAARLMCLEWLYFCELYAFMQGKMHVNLFLIDGIGQQHAHMFLFTMTGWRDWQTGINFKWWRLLAIILPS